MEMSFVRRNAVARAHRVSNNIRRNAFKTSSKEVIVSELIHNPVNEFSQDLSFGIRAGINAFQLQIGFPEG